MGFVDEKYGPREARPFALDCPYLLLFRLVYCCLTGRVLCIYGSSWFNERPHVCVYLCVAVSRGRLSLPNLYPKTLRSIIGRINILCASTHGLPGPASGYRIQLDNNIISIAFQIAQQLRCAPRRPNRRASLQTNHHGAWRRKAAATTKKRVPVKHLIKN